jgi:hypothetical protein
MKVAINTEHCINGILKASSITPTKSGAAMLRTMRIRAEKDRQTISFMSTDASTEYIGIYPADSIWIELRSADGNMLIDNTSAITIYPGLDPDEEMTIDNILVRMAQLNNRKAVLDRMRKQQPKARLNTSLYSARKTTPEYQYINYDLELIKKEYERIDGEIAAMQIALDKYNQTVEFDVDI